MPGNTKYARAITGVNAVKAPCAATAPGPSATGRTALSAGLILRSSDVWTPMDLEPLPEAIRWLTGAGGARWLAGPAAKEVGEAGGRWTRAAIENLERVISVAMKKLGDSEPEGLSARVASRIAAEAAVTDDELVAEYLGGVLASSAQEGTDRGVAWARTIESLPAVDLQVHFAIYEAVARMGRNRGLNMGLSAEREKLALFIPRDSVAEVVEVGGPVSRLTETLMNLSAMSLTSQHAYLDADAYRTRRFAPYDVAAVPDGESLWVEPSVRGVDLFMWGIGLGNAPRILFQTEVIDEYLPEDARRFPEVILAKSDESAGDAP